MTSTCWPSFTTSEQRKTRLCESSEMWTSPSMPGSNSTNAPKSMSLVTFRGDRVGRVLLRGRSPGAFLQVAVGQADLAGLRIDAVDPHLELLSLVEHVAWMLDAAPGQLADVQQAVDAADIDEGPNPSASARRRRRFGPAAAS